MLARNVEQPAGILEKEVMMVTDVGVEIGVAGIHHHLAQQPCLDELVQRIVDGRERQTVASTASPYSCSAVTCRSPCSNRSRTSASLCRVGRKCAARSSSRALVKGRDTVMTLI